MIKGEVMSNYTRGDSMSVDLRNRSFDLLHHENRSVLTRNELQNISNSNFLGVNTINQREHDANRGGWGFLLRLKDLLFGKRHYSDSADFLSRPRVAAKFIALRNARSVDDRYTVGWSDFVIEKVNDNLNFKVAVWLTDKSDIFVQFIVAEGKRIFSIPCDSTVSKERVSLILLEAQDSRCFRIYYPIHGKSGYMQFYVDELLKEPKVHGVYEDGSYKIDISNNSQRIVDTQDCDLMRMREKDASAASAVSCLSGRAFEFIRGVRETPEAFQVGVLHHKSNGYTNEYIFFMPDNNVDDMNGHLERANKHVTSHISSRNVFVKLLHSKDNNYFAFINFNGISKDKVCSFEVFANRYKCVDVAYKDNRRFIGLMRLFGNREGEFFRGSNVDLMVKKALGFIYHDVRDNALLLQLRYVDSSYPVKLAKYQLRQDVDFCRMMGANAVLCVSNNDEIAEKVSFVLPAGKDSVILRQEMLYANATTLLGMPLGRFNAYAIDEPTGLTTDAELTSAAKVVPGDSHSVSTEAPNVDGVSLDVVTTKNVIENSTAKVVSEGSHSVSTEAPNVDGVSLDVVTTKNVIENSTAKVVPGDSHSVSTEAPNVDGVSLDVVTTKNVIENSTAKVVSEGSHSVSTEAPNVDGVSLDVVTTKNVIENSTAKVVPGDSHSVSTEAPNVDGVSLDVVTTKNVIENSTAKVVSEGSHSVSTEAPNVDGVSLDVVTTKNVIESSKTEPTLGSDDDIKHVSENDEVKDNTQIGVDKVEGDFSIASNNPINESIDLSTGNYDIGNHKPTTSEDVVGNQVIIICSIIASCILVVVIAVAVFILCRSKGTIVNNRHNIIVRDMLNITMNPSGIHASCEKEEFVFGAPSSVCRVVRGLYTSFDSLDRLDPEGGEAELHDNSSVINHSGMACALDAPCNGDKIEPDYSGHRQGFSPRRVSGVTEYDFLHAKPGSSFLSSFDSIAFVESKYKGYVDNLAEVQVESVCRADVKESSL